MAKFRALNRTCRSELGCKVLIRNVYEASDSKNPDDAASDFSLKKTKRTSRSQPVSLKRLTTPKTKMDIETGWKQTTRIDIGMAILAFILYATPVGEFLHKLNIANIEFK
jgi:hypothetical protein